MNPDNLFSDEWDVKRKLNLLGLTSGQFKQVALKVAQARANTVAYDPKNSKGTFAYHAGVRNLRLQLCRDNQWVPETNNSSELVSNKSLGIKIAYQNVDYACREEHMPQPLSKKGNAAQVAITHNQMNLFLNDHDDNGLPLNTTWYFMFSENNGFLNAELSLPSKISQSGYFEEIHERIFLLKDYEHETSIENEELNYLNDDDDQEYNIEISRK